MLSPPPPPFLKLSLRKTQEWQSQVASHEILISSFPPVPATVSGNEPQASHHIQHVAQLYRAREGLLGAACDTVIPERAMPSHLTPSRVISGSGAWGPKGIRYPRFTLRCLGTEPLRSCQAGDARGLRGKWRGIVHNGLEANPKGTSGAAIEAWQLSSHFSPAGLPF